MKKTPNRSKTNTLSLFDDGVDDEEDGGLFSAPTKPKKEEKSEDKVRKLNSAI